MRTHIINGIEITENLAAVLAGKNLRQCIRRVTPTKQAQRDPITFLDDVIYKRATGVLVRGWVEEATATVLYICNDATGRTVAAPRNRVRRAAQ